MRSYVFGLLIAAAASIFAFIFVLVFLNPYTSGWIGPTLLLTSLYIFITSIFTLLGFVIRVWRSNNEIIYAHLGTAFRQGLLLGLVLIGSLVLQLFGIFNIWSAVLFVVAVVLVELAFQTQASLALRREQQAQPEKPRVTDVIPPHSKSEPWPTRISSKQ